MRRSVRIAATTVLLASAWVSAGLTPLTDALTGVPAPIDFARDYVAAHMRFHVGRGAMPTNETGNTYAATLGAPRVALLEGPYYVHPPPALLPILPLVPLGFGGAALAWLAISLVALGALASSLVALGNDREPSSHAHVVVAFMLLLLWPPVLHNLAKGQWSILLAALIAAGFRGLERGRPHTAGIWLGLAASLKATPLLLLGFLALRYRRAAWSMLATLAAAGLISLVVGGVAPWRAWLANAPRDVAAWQTWTANTVSLDGFVARLLAGGPFARPLVAAPTLARALVIAVSLALVAGSSLVTRRATASRQSDRRIFAAWVALVILLNPLAWTHTATLALIPLALLWNEAPALAAAALVALTVPRETLATLAGAVPVSPAAGLALSLHAAAVVALFAIGARTERSSRHRRADVIP